MVTSAAFKGPRSGRAVTFDRCPKQGVLAIVDGMASYLDPVTTVLGEDECWRMLARADVGRLAVSVSGEPLIFPVNFVIDNRSVLFRTAEGTKLASLAVSARVAFEVDGFDAATGEAWSVVVRGTAKVLEKLNDVYAAQELPLFPWEATPKPVFVRITPRAVTGRRFIAARGPRED
jgi:nitroimidazol reductase NimA-like FMN-containing flavoprotein (pyridoxamine 5'-phosphate oxidase superfamily)